jgi:CheY-like chemotaxis protein
LPAALGFCLPKSNWKAMRGPAEGVEMAHGARALLVMASRYTAHVWAALEARGFEIDHVLNCHEARDFFRRGADVDLVVSDLSLPDGNWWTISRELSQLGHRASLVVCASPEAGADSGSQPFPRGLAEVITPPFDRAAIECVLEKLGIPGYAVLEMAAGF